MFEREDLDAAKKIVQKAAPGLCTLKQLYGDEWQRIGRHQLYGRQFRASVLHGDVPGVSWVRQRSDKSHEYEVSTRPGVVASGERRRGKVVTADTSVRSGRDWQASLKLKEGEKLGELQRVTTGNLGQRDVDRYDVIDATEQKVGTVIHTVSTSLTPPFNNRNRLRQEDLGGTVVVDKQW